MGLFYLNCECGATLKVFSMPNMVGNQTGASNHLCPRCLQARRSAARPESERLIRRLHLLAITAQDEGPEADIIRDRLVELDRYLTPEDRKEIKRISAELWAEYDRSKGYAPPKTQEETNWLAPITSQELQEWEVSAQHNFTLDGRDVLRLIAEVRALRCHLNPPVAYKENDNDSD